MSFLIETELEEDRRWIADVLKLSGVMVYGETQQDAIERVKLLAQQVIADRLEHDEAIPNGSN